MRVIHNSTKTQLYFVWQNMKKRCLCKKTVGYKNYGGRGITICDEWVNNFANFKKWALANGYKEEKQNGRNILTLDRIDVDKGYSPDNCRWITMKEQCANKRNTARVKTIYGEVTLEELSKITAIPMTTLKTRHFREGKQGDDLIYNGNLKQRKGLSPVMQYDLNGNFIKEFKTIRDAIKEVDAHLSNIYACCKGKIKTCKGYIWRYKE